MDLLIASCRRRHRHRRHRRRQGDRPRRRRRARLDRRRHRHRLHLRQGDRVGRPPARDEGRAAGIRWLGFALTEAVAFYTFIFGLIAFFL